ncbi:hypothetical protein [Methylobacterium sp. Leaf99]|uniref:hypothetical protein n=1 Tax=Methylobacterium sp. Leaf99 TaxID=1736251 RepID=UPI0012ED318D|nr:hypothetical protein [Methylobacterium sp. Leaf99]
MDTAAEQNLQARRNAFHDTLFKEDDLGLVIRGHIHVENELIEFIKIRLSPPNAVDALSLGYKEKCKLAKVLGMPRALQAPLSYAGNLRNKFAHNLGVTIGKQEADSFNIALKEHGIEYFQEAYHRIYPTSTKRLNFWNAHDFEPKNRIVISLILLWSGLAVANIEARAGKRILGERSTAPLAPGEPQNI